MSVVTVHDYRMRTGDRSTPYTEVEYLLDKATKAVEEALRRHLESAERTEAMQLHPARGTLGNWYGARLYPKATPVTALHASAVAAGVAIETGSVLTTGSRYPDIVIEPYHTVLAPLNVTYTGGFTATTLPVALSWAIIDVASASRPDDEGGFPAGAKSVSLGDASVVFKDGDAAMAFLDSLVPGISGTLAGYRKRSL